MTGAQIRAMRQALGFTQTALAQAVGVSGACVALWEARGEDDATPLRHSRKWDALVLFLSTSKRPEPERPAPPSSAGLLYPWLPTAGHEFRAHVRATVRAA